MLYLPSILLAVFARVLLSPVVIFINQPSRCLATGPSRSLECGFSDSTRAMAVSQATEPTFTTQYFPSIIMNGTLNNTFGSYFNATPANPASLIGPITIDIGTVFSNSEPRYEDQSDYQGQIPDYGDWAPFVSQADMLCYPLLLPVPAATDVICDSKKLCIPLPSYYRSPEATPSSTRRAGDGEEDASSPRATGLGDTASILGLENEAETVAKASAAAAEGNQQEPLHNLSQKRIIWHHILDFRKALIPRSTPSEVHGRHKDAQVFNPVTIDTIIVDSPPDQREQLQQQTQQQSQLQPIQGSQNAGGGQYDETVPLGPGSHPGSPPYGPFKQCRLPKIFDGICQGSVIPCIAIATFLLGVWLVYTPPTDDPDDQRMNNPPARGPAGLNGWKFVDVTRWNQIACFFLTCLMTFGAGIIILGAFLGGLCNSVKAECEFRDANE